MLIANGLCQVAFRRYRIVDVDSTHSCFTAVFTLHLRWQDHSLSNEEFEANNAWSSTWRPAWFPHLDWLNETGMR